MSFPIRTLCAGLLLLFMACTHQKAAVSGRELYAADQEGSLRFMTYNVLTGFQKNPAQAERFVQWIKKQDIDILAIQELSSFSQDTLQKMAQRYGHPYAVFHKGNRAPVGITSKYPITDVQLISDSMHHGLLEVKVAGYHVFATHLNPFSYQKCREEMSFILGLAAKIPATEKILIAGDLNSFSPQDSLHYTWTHNFGVLQLAFDHGFTDAFKMISKNFESSFPTVSHESPKRKQTRIDYVLVNSAAAPGVQQARIIRDSVTDNLSDHYPLLIEFK